VRARRVLLELDLGILEHVEVLLLLFMLFAGRRKGRGGGRVSER